MKPDEMECIGRVVGIDNFLKSIQRFVFIVQSYINGIIQLLLPVLARGSELQATSKKKNSQFFQKICFAQKYIKFFRSFNALEIGLSGEGSDGFLNEIDEGGLANKPDNRE